MMVSIGLVTRFNQINMRIADLNVKVKSYENSWSSVYRTFTKFSSRFTDGQWDDVELNSFWLRSSVRTRGESWSRTSISHSYVEPQQFIFHLLPTAQYLYVSSFVCLQNCLYEKLLIIHYTRLRSLPHTISYVYFWVSLIYLFGRTLTAQFLAALIHDTSSHPLEELKNAAYCVEVGRFVGNLHEKLHMMGERRRWLILIIVNYF